MLNAVLLLLTADEGIRGGSGGDLASWLMNPITHIVTVAITIVNLPIKFPLTLKP